MLTYKAPLRDIRFVLYELLGAGELTQLPGFAEASPDLVGAVLEEAAKFCETKLLPLNQAGDREGCRFENGVVRAPPGSRRPMRHLPKAAGPASPAIRRMAARVCRRR